MHDHADSGGDPVVIAEHVSVPLGDAVKLINKISQNLHTEMLLRTVARPSGPWATADDMMKVPADFYAMAGIEPGDVIQTDASGLSRHDLVTPQAIVTLLGFAQKQPWFGCETSRDLKPLAAGKRQMLGHQPSPIEQSELLEYLLRLRFGHSRRTLAAATVHYSQCDILEHRHCRKHTHQLERTGYTFFGNATRAGPGDGIAVKPDLSGAWFQRAGD